MKTRAITDSIRQVASAEFPTRFGNFRIFGFEHDLDQGGWMRREEALALIRGDVKSAPPLLRIHSQCITGDTLGSLRCDCGQQLRMAFRLIAREGAGVIIYEAQEGRGIGLITKLQAYELQDLGADTVDANQQLGLKADYRNFDLPAAILKHFGLTRVRLLTNNPDKVTALEHAGIEIVERVPCEVRPNRQAERYLKTKKERLGQLLTLQGPSD